jgi:hypothetical protein
LEELGGAGGVGGESPVERIKGLKQRAASCRGVLGEERFCALAREAHLDPEKIHARGVGPMEAFVVRLEALVGEVAA